MNKIQVYDNGGKTFDRYAVVLGKDVYTMSNNPNSPQGFNQWWGEVYEVVDDGLLGKKLDHIPECLREAILNRLKG